MLMFKKSIFLKIFSLYVLITLLLSSTILFFSFNSIKSHYVNMLTQNLVNLGAALGIQTAPLVKNKQFRELDSLIKKLDKDINTRITVIDLEGMVLADSENDPKSMENHKYRPEVLKALSGEIGQSFRLSSTKNEDMLYVALPLKENNKITGVLRVSLFLKQINTLLNGLKNSIFRIVLIILAVFMLIALFFSRTLSGPIKILTAAANRVAKGDFTAKAYLKNKDEFKQLADSFNYMTAEVKSSFENVSRQKEELDSIISSIHEGLALIGRDDKIILCNNAFKNIAGTGGETIESKLYWEIFRDPKLSELIKSTRKDNKYQTGETELNNKPVLLSVTGLETNDEIVLLLRDITESKKLEAVKKDFVANVSHELKSPLTAIKGFVETMEEEDEINKHYMEVIKRNIDRLMSIVQDLSLLSNLESPVEKTEFQNVGLKELIVSVTKIFEKQISGKNLRLKLDFEKNLPSITADPFKLEQLFVNLLDNAIKYTDKGEITVSAAQFGAFIKIEVADTGIGVPREHLSRIFERFYVVDKSRSRKLGGTGLGLSIVKHIVLLHKGSITVDSLSGKGTKFVINLPIKI
ncbi:MAG: hypothetical protein A3J83_03705 [Elusimicrobia bacterium RIFOXYA2_FULL_40_6]|nr:MAG: hypothetical protein A3J83_03705 [Elusimicrobia bacterium RIFOXYA2_FULL_40_6]